QPKPSPATPKARSATKALVRAAQSQSSTHALTWAASALFLVSGATGLAYEVIWFKRFSHIWGSSTLAMAAVVASFLTRLGAGAHRLGGTADRVGSPLRAYALCEIGIGLLAILIPAEISWLLALSPTVYGPLHAHPWAHSLARFLLTFVVI